MVGSCGISNVKIGDFSAMPEIQVWRFYLDLAISEPIFREPTIARKYQKKSRIDIKLLEPAENGNVLEIILGFKGVDIVWPGRFFPWECGCSGIF